jgi:O-antigen/teichoic acid export membrane protein
LARLLSPQDFGLLALAIVAVDVARIVSSAGLTDAVTRDKDWDELLADTAFWANLALRRIVGALTWVLAPLYASVVEQPWSSAASRCWCRFRR